MPQKFINQIIIRYSTSNLTKAFIEELKKLKVIEAIPHVMSADMQMAYSEEELSSHLEVLENADAVPKVLNDPTVSASNMVYNGDLKKKDLEGFAKTFDQTK